MKSSSPAPRAISATVAIHDAALLIAIFYAPIMWGAFNAGGLAFSAVLIVVAALAAIVIRWSQGKSPAVIPNTIHLPVLAFVAVSAVSALFAVSIHSSAIEWARIASGALLFALVANRAVLPLPRPKPVAIIVACSAVLVLFIRVAGESDIDLTALFDPATYLPSLSGVGVMLRVLAVASLAALVGVILLDREKPRPVRWYVTALLFSGALVVAANGIREKLLAGSMLHNESWNIFSTFFNPNPLAGFLAMSFYIALAAAIADRLLWRRILWAGCALALAAAIIPTSSKGGEVSFAVAAVVFGILAAGAAANRARNLRVIAILVVLAVLVGAIAIYRVPSIRSHVASAFGSGNTSNKFRILAWEGTARMAFAHPILGVGPGGFKFAFMRYAVGGYTEAAHENYLQIAAEQGFVGLAAFLWIIAAAILTARRALARAPDFGRRVLVIGALSSLVVFLAHSFLDYDYYIGAVGLVFWFLLGLIVHYAYDEPASQPQAQPAEAPKTKRRAGQSAQPAPAPSPEIGFRQLPWPSTPAGRAAVAAGILLCLCFVVAPPVRGALGENALRFGDGAYAAAISAHGNGDPASMRNYFDSAYENFKRATELDPGWSAAWERYGVMLSAMGRADEGEEAIKKAIALEPTNFQPHLSLARLYYEQADSPQSNGQLDSRQQDLYRKAAEAYTQSLARYPNNTRALRRLGAVYQQLGDTENALRTYRKMEQVEGTDYNKYRALADIDVDTEYAYAHYQLGRAAVKDYTKHARRESLMDAANEFKATIGVVSAYQTTGKKIDEMFRMVGQPRENRDAEMRVLEARSRYRLADIYAKLGDAPSAAAERAKALSFLPDVAQAILTEDAGKPL